MEDFPGKSNSEALRAALAQLSTDQIRFVVARQHCDSDKEAAEECKIKVDTVYHWPDVVREAARLMAFDGVIVAAEVLRRNVAKAAMIKAQGLESKDERVRQDAATEILDREIGKPVQRQQQSGAIETAVKLVEVVRPAPPAEATEKSGDG